MGAKSQKKGAAGEQELVAQLRRAGYPVRWGGNKTYGAVPDVSGLPGVHIECKRVEHLNLVRSMAQAERDAHRFRDGLPAVFHKRDRGPWFVTMQLRDWLQLYGATLDQDLDARVFLRETNINSEKSEKGAKRPMETPRYWQEEPGKIIDTGKNVLEYYPRAMKLSIANPSWKNARGEEKRGKTVVLDLSAVRDNPEAAAMFRRIAERMKEV